MGCITEGWHYLVMNVGSSSNPQIRSWQLTFYRTRVKCLKRSKCLDYLHRHKWWKEMQVESILYRTMVGVFGRHGGWPKADNPGGDGNRRRRSRSTPEKRDAPRLHSGLVSRHQPLLPNPQSKPPPFLPHLIRHIFELCCSYNGSLNA